MARAGFGCFVDLVWLCWVWFGLLCWVWFGLVSWFVLLLSRKSVACECL